MAWDARLDYTSRLVDVASVAANGERVVETVRIRNYFIELASQSGFVLTFSIARRKGKFTLRDEREALTGSSGSAGLWGTRQPNRPGEGRSLTPTAWKAEVSRMIGGDRADAIIQEYEAAIAEAEARREIRRERRGNANSTKRGR